MEISLTARLDRSRVVGVDIDPHLRQIWIKRRSVKAGQGYWFRGYRHTMRRAFRLYDACVRSGLRWSQDRQGTHFNL